MNLPFKEISEETFSAALDKVLNDKSYTEAAKKLGDSLAKNQVRRIIPCSSKISSGRSRISRSNKKVVVVAVATKH